MLQAFVRARRWKVDSTSRAPSPQARRGAAFEELRHREPTRIEQRGGPLWTANSQHQRAKSARGDDKLRRQVFVGVAYRGLPQGDPRLINIQHDVPRRTFVLSSPHTQIANSVTACACTLQTLQHICSTFAACRATFFSSNCSYESRLSSLHVN